jgi:hypothetical protein
MTQTSKSLLAVLVTCLILHCPLIAQIKANYHFGFIGATGDTSAKISESVMIQYSKCFDVTNGLTKFSSPKFGAFAIVCVEIPPKVDLLVNAYPNPVVNRLTIRSLSNYPERGVVRYSVLLTDLSGKPIKEIKTDLTSINQGFTIPVNDLPMGYFIVTLYADKERIQSFKILKAA